MAENENKKFGVLIVEDDEALLDSYAEVVEAEGYTVYKAVDGYKALDMLESEKGKIHIVLLDLMMPGIDGMDVLRTMQSGTSKYGKVPTVVLTNMVSEKVIKECYELGATSYLIKTELSTEDLINDIKRTLTSK